jgi:DNA (cytosine-5)-methyltransferase 1
MATVLSLFAGCGGMDLGFRQAGHNIVVANEFWEPAVKTYRRNFCKTKMVHGDITDPKIQDELAVACGGSCDILIGGAPCQSFSLSGLRDPSDPRGRLFESYIKMVKITKPLFTVMENVTGILSMKHSDGKVVDLITNKMRATGYEVKYKTLDAADFGTPQHRKRVIFLGLRQDIADTSPKVFPFPIVTHSDQGDLFIKLKPFVTIRQVIGDLVDIPEKREWNHVFTKHSQEYIAKIRKTRIGTSVTKYSESCFRCHPDFPSKTVKANNGGVFIHYELDRCMSARELARLQGFPDDFIFEGSKSDVLRQIGNAVPPPLARAISLRLSDFLKRG